MVSPRRPDANDGAGAGPARQFSSERFQDGPEVDGKIRMSGDIVKGNSDSTVEEINDLGSRTGSPEMSMNDDPTWLLEGSRFENDRLTLTMKEV